MRGCGGGWDRILMRGYTNPDATTSMSRACERGPVRRQTSSMMDPNKRGMVRSGVMYIPAPCGGVERHQTKAGARRQGTMVRATAHR